MSDPEFVGTGNNDAEERTNAGQQKKSDNSKMAQCENEVTGITQELRSPELQTKKPPLPEVFFISLGWSSILRVELLQPTKRLLLFCQYFLRYGCLQEQLQQFLVSYPSLLFFRPLL